MSECNARRFQRQKQNTKNIIRDIILQLHIRGLGITDGAIYYLGYPSPLDRLLILQSTCPYRKSSAHVGFDLRLVEYHVALEGLLLLVGCL